MNHLTVSMTMGQCDERLPGWRGGRTSGGEPLTIEVLGETFGLFGWNYEANRAGLWTVTLTFHQMTRPTP